MKHLAGVKLTRDQHQHLVDICGMDMVFPPTYAGWLALVRAGEEELKQHGEAVRPIDIDVEQFVSWCRMVGIVPCVDAMKAYAIVRRLGPDEAHLLAMPVLPQSKGGDAHHG